MWVWMCVRLGEINQAHFSQAFKKLFATDRDALPYPLQHKSDGDGDLPL